MKQEEKEEIERRTFLILKRIFCGFYFLILVVMVLTFISFYNNISNGKIRDNTIKEFPVHYVNVCGSLNRTFEETFFHSFLLTHPYKNEIYVCLNLSRDSVRVAREIGLNCSVEVGLTEDEQYGHAWVNCNGNEYYGHRKNFPVHYSPKREHKYKKVN